MIEPIRVYVGTDESQRLAARVLEFTIRKFASRPAEVTPLCGLSVRAPKDPRNRPRTPFSFTRFLIPKLAGFRGRAIYLDADMIVFKDLARLWEIPFGGASVLCTSQERVPRSFKAGRQLSVMLLDCERLRWDVDEIVAGLDSGAFDYDQLLGDLCIVPPEAIADAIPSEWNCLEHYEPGSTALLHYTVVDWQPWRNARNPLRHLWLAAFDEAVASGFITPAEIRSAVDAGEIARELARGAREGELGTLRRWWTWNVGRRLVGPFAAARRWLR